ncbi:Rne/Rng family ribonuclease [Alteraurantiacibacter palmitatis]|uniref:Ribonuclease E n=1 Tax=Alteraurantiacibacter palmitatis TaxID=2054628 RepID=A0ABV7E0Z7_9SPHN
MATRMLIDARHPEETRVAVLKGNRIEEFDFESAEHKQIKGNIYLAKVTRVEPSLQAAFVDFGGNRHGFLAFSEIHPDYYQIPAEDRAKLLAEEQAAAEEEAALRAEEEDEEDDFSGDDDLDGSGVEEIDTSEKDDVATIEDGQVANGDGDEDDGENGSDDDAGSEGEEAEAGDEGRQDRGRGRGRRQGKRSGGGSSRAKEIDDVRAKRQALRRRYKIQDVIQRRQVLLVQVVKEERGNKGAALTTYLSLAGRYCVLMPNSSHGGGISRKISSGSDRKRLKQIVAELNLPRSMGLIVRTAGLQRTKTEIKRDFDYLARLWDEIRERTLASSAPAMIHSDSDLIKRAIRDIYSREIEEVVVEGEGGYRAARDFMKLLMPSHVRRVKAYSDPVPLFQRYGAEDQLSAMYDPVVQLKSGGYLVINPTEALVSIDINSGRSTKEHGIEATALSTNLEAAREIARQLRLRDMAGLVVIDFIDMEHSSNTRKVERAMKEALKNDRARIQIGRISSFGLMEMSRQRLRTGVLEASTRSCPHCDGTGLVRTASSAGLAALRLIEDEAAKGKGTIITLYASTEATIYLLNAKRADLTEIEHRYGVTVQVVPEGENEGAKMRVASSGPRPAEPPRFEPIIDEIEPDEDFAEDEAEDEDEEDQDRDARRSRDGDGERGEGRAKRRRRRGGRNRGRDQDDAAGQEAADEARDESDASDEATAPNGAGDDTEARETRRKRRRRGGRGRGRRRDAGEGTETQESAEGEAVGEVDETPAAAVEAESTGEPAAVEKPKRKRAPRKKAGDAEAGAEEAAPAISQEAAAVENTVEDAPVETAKPKRTRRKKADVSESEAAAPAVESEMAAAEAPAEPAKPKRTRRKKTETADTKAAEPVAAVDEPAAEAQAAPVAQDTVQAANDANGSAEANTEAGEPRRGWWQRTFGQ